MTRIAVFGAGAIGCWVGGRLAAGGADVTLIGRPRVIDELASGLVASPTSTAGVTHGAADARDRRRARRADADVVLVTVKSAQTAEAGRALARRCGARSSSACRTACATPTCCAPPCPAARVLAGHGAVQRRAASRPGTTTAARAAS